MVDLARIERATFTVSWCCDYLCATGPWWFQGRSNPRFWYFKPALSRLSYGTMMEPSAGTDPALPLYRRGVPPPGDGIEQETGLEPAASSLEDWRSST